MITLTLSSVAKIKHEIILPEKLGYTVDQWNNLNKSEQRQKLTFYLKENSQDLIWQLDEYY